MGALLKRMQSHSKHICCMDSILGMKKMKLLLFNVLNAVCSLMRCCNEVMNNILVTISSCLLIDKKRTTLDYAHSLVQ